MSEVPLYVLGLANAPELQEEYNKEWHREKIHKCNEGARNFNDTGTRQAFSTRNGEEEVYLT